LLFQFRIAGVGVTLGGDRGSAGQVGVKLKVGGRDSQISNQILLYAILYN
jgi:hypothetical protein